MEYDNIYMGLDDTTVALVSAMLAIQCCDTPVIMLVLFINTLMVPGAVLPCSTPYTLNCTVVLTTATN